MELVVVVVVVVLVLLLLFSPLSPLSLLEVPLPAVLASTPTEVVVVVATVVVSSLPFILSSMGVGKPEKLDWTGETSAADVVATVVSDSFAELVDSASSTWLFVTLAGGSTRAS